MRLYYFTSQKFGLEAIRDKRLKVALLNELNDPFELLSIGFNDEGRRKLLEVKQKMHVAFGLICMSSSWQQPLLWAHYADNHKGLCLGFDVQTPDLFKPVQYKPTMIGPDDNLDNIWADLPLVKYDAWNYESEFRAFVDLSLAARDPISNHRFLSFRPNLVLREVIAGARSTVTEELIKGVLEFSAFTADVSKASISLSTFDVGRAEDFS
jgi:hypothetical protein